MSEPLIRQTYLNPFRPHFERAAGLAWMVAAALMVAEMFLPHASPRVLFVLAGVCAACAAPWISKWLGLMLIRDRMNTRDVTIMPISEARKEFDPGGERIWIGWGFPWTSEESQLAREVAISDPSKLTPADSPEAPGQSWMHGIGATEEKIYLPVVDEHTLIIAMTRWGKTVLYRSLITQAIARKEAVFVIDPKGDKGLQAACEQACRDMGKKLLVFHPGFPATSVRLDPLKNFTDSSEVASRISGLLGHGSRDNTFTAFAHMQLVNVVNGMLLAGKRPTLVAIKRYMDGHLESLLIDAIKAYCDRVLAPGWERHLEGYRRSVLGRRKRRPDESDGPMLLTPEEDAAAYTAFYREQVLESKGSPEIEGLIATVEHPAEHRSKMLTSLMPVLTKLTSGAMAKLMSTDATDPGDARLITDTARIVEQRQAIYIGLNALGNEDVANAIGEILMADIAAVCGTRYNYAKDKKVVSVLVDEAPEILNNNLIKLLNKGGGAGFRLTLATQTVSDIVARLGDKATAEKVLGNIANLIFGRVTAAESQEYFCSRLPRVPIKSLGLSRSVTSPTSDPLDFSASQGETLRVEMEPPIEPPTLGCLPQLHFFALLGSRFVKGRIPVIVADAAE
ncbi:conjugative transfer system coupling protein TraD [Rhodanobacter denitrificans]|uniref:Conjugative coupling factor TraD, SXT/TOL subfamily n=1 Tax=Rhodanobacter denitrificans TaxID=666685 RepID=M4NN44_9GAMM|nr:conjugative transfer system coupling protein TraD [Rhodanobacter denitrificans]AGG89121.1 conjugative coupling factor TraD, SXT/TOL subfamily [Rhodanobacter denitrificans]UJJ52944.1 conjugative transfer system coupling protein TraD [Rhodanobacter denitrificans]